MPLTLQLSQMNIQNFLSVLILLSLGLVAEAQEVSNQTELDDAINAAQAGTTITLTDGVWKDVFIDIDKEGTDSEPITITAQNPGAVLLTGNSRVYMEGSHLILSGFIFRDPANLVTSGSEIEPVIELKRCDHCKVLNNMIDNYNGTESQKGFKFKWVLADGLYNEIAYNSFIGKYGVGSIINDNRNSSGPDYLSIHHNYFADRTPINELNGDNDQDAIRIGNSSTSLDDSFSEVYSNYFYNFFGEVEVISNKSGQNKYYNNTFRDYAGTLTLRHGNNCEVYGNYFFAENNTFSGGVRVIGEGHKIYNNYIQDVKSTKSDGSTSNATGGINVSNGRENSALNGYYQVKNTQVVNNTIVNCDYAIRVGTKVSSDLNQEPIDLVVANNIMYNSSVNEYQILTEPTGNSISEGNLADMALTDMEEDFDFFRLASTAPAIDRGIGSYAFLTEDILGGSREAAFDVGAEEFGAGGTNLPYKASDVGIIVGFGATSEPTLASAPTQLTFGRYAETMTFQVVANVDWILTVDAPWLTLDILEGSGSTTITASTTENATGEERTATITINEVAGGNSLSSSVEVIQLNTFIPAEIQIVGATSLGKEDKPEIKDENAYNDDLSNYWTGNPDDEEEVSITFDLSCRHLMTEIGINFWKADERTTTFSIAISNKVGGPFRTVIDSATSDPNGSPEVEQRFDMQNSVGRYVKFVGIGNSSSTNWTSIANVNIYGDIGCDTTTATIDIEEMESDLLVYPNPVNGQWVTIESKTETLKTIKILTSDGHQVAQLTGLDTYSERVDVSGFPAGVYFVRINEKDLVKIVVSRG